MSNTKVADRVLRLLGGLSALLLFLVLILGVSTLLTGVPERLPTNWLLSLFKINSSVFRTDPSVLHSINWIDLVIMSLFIPVLAGFLTAPKQYERICSLVSMGLTSLGIPLFFATQTAGRSGLLVSIMVVAAAKLIPGNWQPIGLIGVLSGMLLFVGGDVLTAIVPPSDFIATFVAAGYLLFLVWLLILGIERLAIRGSKISGT